MLTLAIAQNALTLNANGTSITSTQIAVMLGKVSTTFAQIMYVTRVGTAAAHKLVNIQKVTSANVQLFANINEFTQIYSNAVKRSAGKDSGNSKDAVEGFVAKESYFAHSDTCFSLTTHKTQSKEYLYAIYNNADSMYFVDGVLATTQEVAKYLTKSASDKLLNDDGKVYNVGNDIVHDVQVRNIMLSSLVEIKACKQIVTV